MSDSKASLTLSFGVYLATKFWMYVTWFVYFWPYVQTFDILLPFTITSVMLMYNFIKVWRTDAGIIRSTREQKVKVSATFEAAWSRVSVFEVSNE